MPWPRTRQKNRLLVGVTTDHRNPACCPGRKGTQGICCFPEATAWGRCHPMPTSQLNP